MADNSILTEEISPDLLRDQINISIANANHLNVYEKVININDPYSFDWSPFAPSERPLTLKDALSLTSDIINRQQELDGIKEENRIKLVEDYPYDRIKELGLGIIVYRIISRTPAHLGKDNESYKQSGWHHYYEISFSQMPKHKLIIENRLIAHTIEFSLWSKSARVANEKALWLERTLINNSYLYLIKGADRFRWEGRLADNYLNVSGQPLYQRPLRFFMTLNDFRIKAEPLISEINIKLEPIQYETFTTAQLLLYNRLFS